MLNLFNKKSQVKAGKVTVSSKIDENAQGQSKEGKKQVQLIGVTKTWKKLNSMDRKQAYTWGAVGIVLVIGLLMLSSMASSPNQEDFSDFETRGYDLANMPFSSDEAEKYLLAAKYPDMQGSEFDGLYTPAEKAARQAEDEENNEYLDEEEDLAPSLDGIGGDYSGGSYGSGSGGGSGPTQVNTIGHADLKSASGAGLGGNTFGPTGDFSNFKDQEKGYDKAPTKGAGSGDARKALFQTAMASRAAAGLKKDKLLNAKKAMMGGNVKGSGAFMDDSGAVDLSQAAGMDLDTNAPVSSADLTDLGKKLNSKAKDAQKQAEETPWWQQMLQDMAKAFATGLVNAAVSGLTDSTKDAYHSKRADHWQKKADGTTDVGLKNRYQHKADAHYNKVGSSSSGSSGVHLSGDSGTITQNGVTYKYEKTQ